MFSLSLSLSLSFSLSSLYPSYVFLIHIIKHSFIFLAALQIRLNGLVPYAGRVELLLAGIWGSVDRRDWDLKDAHVSCKQFGYQSAELAVLGATFVFNTNTSKAQWMTHVSCQGNETALSECRHNIKFRPGLNSDAGVVCKTNDSGIS